MAPYRGNEDWRSIAADELCGYANDEVPVNTVHRAARMPSSYDAPRLHASVRCILFRITRRSPTSSKYARSGKICRSIYPRTRTARPFMRSAASSGSRVLRAILLLRCLAIDFDCPVGHDAHPYACWLAKAITFLLTFLGQGWRSLTPTVVLVRLLNDSEFAGGFSKGALSGMSRRQRQAQNQKNAT
jgi:hypothetical protein